MYSDSQHVSKARLLKAIRKQCVRCVGGCRSNVIKCKSMDCPLWPYRLKPVQFSIFDDEYKKLWIENVMKIITEMITPFWFSEIQLHVDSAPGHPNWWGGVAKMMIKYGYYQTGNRRKSPRIPANGRREFQWDKKN